MVNPTCCLEPESLGGNSGSSQVSTWESRHVTGLVAESQEFASLLIQGDLQSQAMVRAVARQVCEQLIQSKCPAVTDASLLLVPVSVVMKENASTAMCPCRRGSFTDVHH